MTFEDREKEIFFDVISELTGHFDKTGHIEIGLTKEQIIKRVLERITRKRAIELFEQFASADIKYLEDESVPVYRISAAGRTLYFDHLKLESEKRDLDKKSVQSTIKTGQLTRTNIVFGIVFAFLTLLFIVLNFIINLERESRETDKDKKEILDQLQELKKLIKHDTTTNQIYLHYQDDSSLKVKTEK